MALKLVIEPIFETGFYQSSYAYRPGRRCHDAIAEIYHFAMHSYEWIVETDVEACFDELPHGLITDEVRRRVIDKRALALIRAFLKAGVMTETGRLQRTITGTPQGSIASPLLANIALSALDRQYEADWQQMSSYQGKRQDLRRKGLPTYRLCRYADDLVLMVMGTREQATALLGQLSGRVQALGLKLKAEKTAVTHIDEGFVFLGQRLVRLDYGHKRHVYTFVPNEALASIKHKGKALTGRSTTCLALSELIAALNPVLRGWTTYYQHVSAKRTFGYLDYYVWWRVGRWLRKKHPGLTWKQLNQRYLNDDYTYAGSRARALQTGADTDHSVPLPGSANPDTVDPDASQPAAVARQARQPRRTTGARDRPAGARMKQTPLRVLMESRMR